MTDRLSPILLLRRAAMPAACIGVVGYFGFHAVAGPTGVMAWREYRAERTQAEAEAAELARAKAALERQVALLDPRHVDPDYADELVRKNLGVVRPDEVVVDVPETK